MGLLRHTDPNADLIPVSPLCNQGMKLSDKKDRASVERLLERAKELGIKQTTTDKHHLNLLSDNRPHQGFVLKAKPLDFIDVEVLEAPVGPGEHWLALDEVWDPQNLGALLRSAYFLGMKVRAERTLNRGWERKT